MKRIVLGAVAALLPLALMTGVPATGATAATLMNQDGETYDFHVTDEHGRVDFAIEAGQTLEEVCEEKCKIVIEGVGEVEVIKTDTVVIKDGKVEKRS